MTEPVRYCIADIPEQGFQRLLQDVEGLGDLWITGWCSAGRCVFCYDEATAWKLLALAGGRQFSRDNKSEDEA